VPSPCASADLSAAVRCAGGCGCGHRPWRARIHRTARAPLTHAPVRSRACVDRVWSTTGWLSAYNLDPATPVRGVLGFLDLSGGVVVHALGGTISLCAVAVLGPRAGRFTADGHPTTLQGTVVRAARRVDHPVGTLCAPMESETPQCRFQRAVSGRNGARAARVCGL
jgi:Ammonium Transporter Family